MQERKPKPILFSTPMVQAICEDRKTMTRRVIMPHDPFMASRCGGYRQGNGLWVDRDDKGNPSYIKDYSHSSCWISVKGYIDHLGPYRPGDILWVRETWGSYTEDYPESHAVGYLYRADYPVDATGYWYEEEHINWCDFPKWRPSIFMPKEACRLWLRVKDVKVERVQDISDYDAEREGCPRCIGISACGEDCDGCEANMPRLWFHRIWDDINAGRGYSWDANPWVWAITFERVAKPQGWPEVAA